MGEVYIIIGRITTSRPTVILSLNCGYSSPVLALCGYSGARPCSGWLTYSFEWLTQLWVIAPAFGAIWETFLGGCPSFEWLPQLWVAASALSGYPSSGLLPQLWVAASALGGCSSCLCLPQVSVANPALSSCLSSWWLLQLWEDVTCLGGCPSSGGLSGCATS